MSDFDGVLDSLGGFGSYQRQVFLLVSAFETPAAWAMLLPVFIGATPKWWLLPSSGKILFLFILLYISLCEIQHWMTDNFRMLIQPLLNLQ